MSKFHLVDDNERTPWNEHIIYVFLVAFVIIPAIIFGIPIFTFIVTLFTSPPPTSPSAASRPSLISAWVSGIETCPNSKEYGQLVAGSINLYRTAQGLTVPSSIIGTVPHGAKIEVISKMVREEMTEIRYQGNRGYVQSLFVVTYDPIEQIRPSSDRYCPSTEKVTIKPTVSSKTPRKKFVVSIFKPVPYHVLANANLRTGPGTHFDTVGDIKAGDIVKVLMCNHTCEWYQLSDSTWIEAFLVEKVTENSQPSIISTPTPKVDQIVFLPTPTYTKSP